MADEQEEREANEAFVRALSHKLGCGGDYNIILENVTRIQELAASRSLDAAEQALDQQEHDKLAAIMARINGEAAGDIGGTVLYLHTETDESNGTVVSELRLCPALIATTECDDVPRTVESVKAALRNVADALLMVASG